MTVRSADLHDALAPQDGVVSRRQVLERGGSDADIERMIRRRVLARVFEGVYVEHTGPLTWRQRAWAAVLYHHPAALAGASARVQVASRWAPSGHRSSWWLRRAAGVVDPPGIRTGQVKDFDAVVRRT